MGYKCLDCGHIMDYGEECVTKLTLADGFPDGTLERSCPICGGDVEETTVCLSCLSAHLPDELYEGICAECLREAVTYDDFLRYLEETDTLGQFMFIKIFYMSPPDGISDNLKSTLRELYLRWKADDLLRGTTQFLDKCRAYVMDDDGESGRLDYAEWLNIRKR